MVSRARIFFLAAVLALGLGLGTLKKARSLGSPDFKVFYTAARHALVDPENIYRMSPDRYLYPPSAAILLTPFAFTDYYAFHQWSWHVLLTTIAFVLAAGSGGALAAMALLARYLAITFSYGQINLLVLAILLGCGVLTRRERFGAAGSVWAFAVGLKLYPIVLAPAFSPRRRWAAFVGAASGAVMLLALPFLFFGLGLGTRLYGEFFQALQDKGLPLHSHNQSIAALFLRLFTRQHFYLHAVGDAQWGLADLPPGLLEGLALALGATLAALSWFRAWTRGARAEACLSAAAFSILFLSHIVWKDYLLFLYFPLREGFSAWPRRKAFFVAGAFFALITFSSPDFLQLAVGWLGPRLAGPLGTEPGTIGHALSVRADAACIHLWAATLVWGAWWT